ncbi:DUF6954 family protein [Tissierella sp.]|uniref:DUF6954 family protein n=1 Tax=Tissierella sp. TaxID=41274 RepID=UPI002857FE9E|nr:hypothetical protein [Tissierella sp.]MDR7855127.1 hypothetical protein [Tissierella sp.]
MKNSGALKILGYIIFIALFLGVTFFGIDPVLFADGQMTERIVTLIIVLLIYGVLIMLFRYFLKRIK